MRAIVLALLFCVPAMADSGRCLVEAARKQIGVTVVYDSGYRRLPYPNGDVPQDRGVCTDVLVRAYRQLGVDLQVRVHEDMSAAWRAYPKNWGLSRPDSNIDHRRVPQPGDLLHAQGQVASGLPERQGLCARRPRTWRLPSGVPHIGIVSDRKAASGVPLVIHNIGQGTQEEDALFVFTLTGHYRYAPEDLRPCSR